jgi:hypothetical protein
MSRKTRGRLRETTWVDGGSGQRQVYDTSTVASGYEEEGARDQSGVVPEPGASRAQRPIAVQNGERPEMRFNAA